MRILFLQKEFNPSGGVERVTLRLISEFKEKGHDVDICVMNNNTVDHEVSVVKNTAQGYLGFILLLRRLLAEKNYDIAISAKEKSNLALGIACLFTKTKCLYVRHSSIGKNIGLVYSTFIMLLYLFLRIRRKSYIAAVSKEIVNRIKKWTPLLKSKVFYLPNAVIDDSFYNDSKMPIPSELEKVASDAIISVGRLIPSKRIDDLIKAFSLVKDELEKNINLVIVGTGSEQEKLKNLAHELGVGARTFFLGYHKNPYPLIRISKAVVLASEIEGLPTIIIEALALEKPVIASNCKTGPSELLENGKYGFLFNVGDIKELSRLLVEVSKGNNVNINSGESYKNFTARNSAEKHLEIFINE